MSVGRDVKWCPVSRITTPLARKRPFPLISMKSRLVRAASETSKFRNRLHLTNSRCRYMAEILPIRHETLSNQSINWIINISAYIYFNFVSVRRQVHVRLYSSILCLFIEQSFKSWRKHEIKYSHMLSKHSWTNKARSPPEKSYGGHFFKMAAASPKYFSFLPRSIVNTDPCYLSFIVNNKIMKFCLLFFYHKWQVFF